MVLIVWCYSFTFSIVPALNIGFSKYVPEGYLTSCSFDYLDKSLKARIFMFVFFIFAWFIPFSIIMYCYIYILKVVISSRDIRSNLDKHQTEIKLSIIVIGVIILWFVAWTPYSIVALLGISGNEDKISPLISMIPAIFCKASASINPYVYAITHPKFRREFVRVFLCRVGKDKTSHFQCNPSITHRHNITTDIHSIKLQKNKLKIQNSLCEHEIERETNLSTKYLQKNDQNIVMDIKKSYPDEIEIVNVLEE